MNPIFVAVTTRTLTTSHGDPHDALSRDWSNIFKTFNLIPLLIPNHPKDPTPLLDRCDALILTGGDDPPPSWPPPQTNPRDVCESKLLASAMKRKLPILGVCRGLQILNLWFGGSCTPNLNHWEPGHVAQEHRVTLHGLFAEKAQCHELSVNSFHQYGVLSTNLSKELQTTAKTVGGVVEALIHPTLPVTAVQWHPERQKHFSPLDRYLFGAFLRK